MGQTGKPRRRLQDVRGELIGALRAGVSITDAAIQVGVAPRTVKHWLTRGRREPGSVYAQFLEAVDRAREQSGDTGPMDYPELRRVVSRAARNGSVPAMKLYREMLRADQDAGQDAKPPEPAEEDPLAAWDELAQRRQAASRRS